MATTHLSGLNVSGRSGTGNGTLAGTDLSLIMRGSVTIDPASISAGAEATVTATITGAKTGDTLILNQPTAGLTTGMSVAGAWVSAANTISVRLRNHSAGAIDEASASWTYMIVR